MGLKVQTILPLRMEPWRCGLCDFQAVNPHTYPVTTLTADMPKIQLRCGHEYHTHCYMYRTMATEDLPVHERCPNDECDEYIIPPDIRAFFLEQDERINNDTVIKLWNENKEFRDELKNLIKTRREFKKKMSIYRPKHRQLIRKFKEITRPYVEGIKHEKKQYKFQVSNMPEKKDATLASARLRRSYNKFLKKYNIWSSSLRALIGIRGVPRIPRRGHFGISWTERRSLQGNGFYIRI